MATIIPGLRTDRAVEMARATARRRRGRFWSRRSDGQLEADLVEVVVHAIGLVEKDAYVYGWVCPNRHNVNPHGHDAARGGTWCPECKQYVTQHRLVAFPPIEGP